MKQFRLALAVMLLAGMFICPLHATGYAEDGQDGYYAGENGRYSFELTEGNYCYWYQDEKRFAGKYEACEDGFDLNLIGSGYTKDTSFHASTQEDGSLKVCGGLVDGELFSKAEKPQEIMDVDQLWAKRIRHSRKSSGKISLTEMVLLDRDDVRITATKYSANGNDEEVRLLLENDGDQQVTIRTTSVLFNGKAADIFCYSSLAPHETKKETLWINAAMLEALNIEKIEEITMMFSLETPDETVFVSDAVPIPVQDSRNRVPVLIPIGKNVVRTDKLGIELIGYENTGYSIDLYYRVRNDAENEFAVRTSKTSINGEAGSDYAINQDIAGSSDMLYRANFYKADYSSTGKLKSLEFDLLLEPAYNKTFIKFEKISMEFEQDGQLCGFEFNVDLNEDSDFWQDNFAEYDESGKA